VARDFTVLLIGTSSAFAAYPLKAISQVYPLAGIVESARRDFNSHSLLPRLAFKLEQWLAPHSLWRMARQLKVPYYLYLKEDKAPFIQFLKWTQPDVGVVVSMNHLLSDQALSIPRCGFINMHPSLLPDLRGPHVWTWLYYGNDRQGGVTINRTDSGEDSGDILKQESFPIFSGMPPERLMDISIRLGTRLLLEALEDIRQGKSIPIPQPVYQELRRARRLKKEEHLFPYRSWDLEHTYHFLQGARRWYSPFKLKKGSGEVLDWIPTGFLPSPVEENKIGTIRMDWRGFYFSHPQGKIRLKLSIRPLALFLFLLLVFAGVNFLLGK
jgi:methionyl-tRNA formyltransferase